MPINYERWDDLVDSSDDECSATRKSKDAPLTTKPELMAPGASSLRSMSSTSMAGHAAVCSTMKDVCARITSWVRWHLWLGFERLYIFFDDASESESVDLARRAGGAAVVPLLRDSEAVCAGWSRQASWASLGADADRDVQIRQLLNAQLAMELAREDGLHWLLHLDSDELFLPCGSGGMETRGAQRGSRMLARKPAGRRLQRGVL